ncbi:hypothetical protein ANCCAN_14924 [Ancylostoma caninum]|uniref:Band 7 domain-containing protein n=1 Tax=Ancylostoma caninum TaxID=29170 RepID=A0A368G663_ANCCA|nr:hypothetical protein ANCCAN_14924 [Ancylostoma caninum]
MDVLTVTNCYLYYFPIFKVVQEYERAVIFRLGRLMPGGAKGPGIFFVLPCIDSYKKIDLRVVSFDVPPQEILSKDSVTVAVDAVVYFRISNATISVRSFFEQINVPLLPLFVLSHIAFSYIRLKFSSHRGAI